MKSERTVYLPRKDALPYRHAEAGIELRLDSCSLDSGEEVPISAHGRFVDLKQWANWKQLHVKGTISVPDSVVETVFPPDEHEAPPGRLLLVVWCLPTILREGREVHPGPALVGAHPFDLVLSRDQFRGVVTLEARLVRTAPRDAGEGLFASDGQVHLATSDVVELELDELELRRGFLTVRWEPLEEGLVYQLDTSDPTKPVLLLNNKHPALYRILNSPGTTGREARMRDVVFEQIYYGVWMQLIHRTAADIDPDDHVRQDWQKGVLRFVGEILYPEIPTLDEVAQKLRTSLEYPDTVASLTEQLDVRLQAEMEFSHRVNQLAMEGKDK